MVSGIRIRASEHDCDSWAMGVRISSDTQKFGRLKIFTIFAQTILAQQSMFISYMIVGNLRADEKSGSGVFLLS